MAVHERIGPTLVYRKVCNFDARERPVRSGSLGSIPGVDRVGRKMANFGRWRVKTALPLAGVVALHYHVGTTTMGTACRYKAVIALLSRSYSKRRSRFRS